MIKEISTKGYTINDQLDKTVIDTINKLVKVHNSQEKSKLTETEITIHILRNWDRKKIVSFCKHLLGDICQNCNKIK